jgi:hypothetical protein
LTYDLVQAQSQVPLTLLPVQHLAPTQGMYPSTRAVLPAVTVAEVQ